MNSYESLTEIKNGIPLKGTDILNFVNKGLNLYGNNAVKIIEYDNLDSVSIQQIMNGTATILFHRNNSGSVGHYTTFIPHPNNVLEYVDSMGYKTPDLTNDALNKGVQHQNFANLIYRTPNPPRILTISKKLQGNYSNVCGKYSISRIMSSKVPLPLWEQALGGNSHVSADMIVDMLYEIPITQGYSSVRA